MILKYIMSYSSQKDVNILENMYQFYNLLGSSPLSRYPIYVFIQSIHMKLVCFFAQVVFKP